MRPSGVERDRCNQVHLDTCGKRKEVKLVFFYLFG